MRSFHIKPGIIISLSIGCIFSLRLLLPPRMRYLRHDIKHPAEPGLSDFLQPIVIISLFAFGCWLIHQYLQQTQITQRWFNKKWVKGVTGVLLCILLSYLFEQLQQVVFSSLIQDRGEQVRKIFFLNLRGLIIGSFQLFIVYYVAALKDAQQARVELEQLKKENLEARLNLLKQQISPHFLFNSLSTLKTIAPDHNTREYIMQLSYVYRYLLNYNDNNVASLKDELAFTNSYLYILKERYEQALQLHITVSDELLSFNIPPLSLQTLVENAIKHNIISLTEPLHIYIYNEGINVLTVENNIQPKLSIEKNTGKGLQNINDRYQLLSGKHIQIMNTGAKFIVKLPLLQP